MGSDPEIEALLWPIMVDRLHTAVYSDRAGAPRSLSRGVMVRWRVDAGDARSKYGGLPHGAPPTRKGWTVE
jgi:hypothetical protein